MKFCTSRGFSFLLIAQAGLLTHTALGDADPTPFVGTISYLVTYDDVRTPLRYISDGEKVRVELGTLGSPYRIWLAGLEAIEGDVVLSPVKKSYTVEPSNLRRPRGRPGHDTFSVNQEPHEVAASPPAPAFLEGMECRKVQLKTDGPKTHLWILPQAAPFPAGVLQSWSGMREAVRPVSRSCELEHGIPLQIERKNWMGRTTFALRVESVDHAAPKPTLLSLPDGYDRGGSYGSGGREGGTRGAGRPGGRGAGPPGGGPGRG